MKRTEYIKGKVTVQPIDVWLHVPPTVWKGDRLGHIGINDTFFYVISGECFISIDDKSFMVKAGQLAFLPKGKKRAYTHASDDFVMYEMAFSAQVEGEDLMEYLDLCEGDFAVDIANGAEMREYFESSCRKEMRREPIFDIVWCANIIKIIGEYTKSHKSKNSRDSKLFAPVLEYMSENLDKPIKTEELAERAFMQTTYFIRRFGAFYGLSPQIYLTKMRINRAMTLLSTTEMPIEKIAKSVGIPDTSYFSRVFKKHCGITPGGYRTAFLNER